MNLSEKGRLDRLCLEMASEETVGARQRRGRQRATALSCTTGQKELMVECRKTQRGGDTGDTRSLEVHFSSQSFPVKRSHLIM